MTTPTAQTLYNEARRAHLSVRLRDKVASALGDLVLKLASPQLRALLNDGMREGMTRMAERDGLIAQRFTEPLDD